MLFFVLPIVQASLCDYQGANIIITERKGGTSAQHQDQHPLDYPPTSAEIFTRKNGGYTRMPQVIQKYGEPTHCKKLCKHFTHRSTYRTSTPRRKETEHLDKGRKKSRSPVKKQEEIPRGKRRRGAKETMYHTPLEYRPQRSFVETSN